MGMLFFCLFFVSQASAQSGSVVSEEVQKPKYGFSYWSMLTGPALGNGFSESKGADGQTIAGNYFQMLNANYNFTPNTQVGIQLRTSNDLSGALGDTSLQVLNPRIVAHQKNIIDNSWLNLSLQPMLELPTTSVSRQRTNLFSVLFAQNWTFKTDVKDLTIFASTMVNSRYYQQDAGYSTVELVFMPMLTYQLSKKWQIMTWGWFDSNHVGGGEQFLNSWSDDYARIGLNYSILSNVQIFPCAQMFTNSLALNTTTLGLELAAQF